MGGQLHPGLKVDEVVDEADYEDESAGNEHAEGGGVFLQKGEYANETAKKDGHAANAGDGVFVDFAMPRAVDKTQVKGETPHQWDKQHARHPSQNKG